MAHRGRMVDNSDITPKPVAPSLDSQIRERTMARWQVGAKHRLTKTSPPETLVNCLATTPLLSPSSPALPQSDQLRVISPISLSLYLGSNAQASYRDPAAAPETVLARSRP